MVSNYLHSKPDPREKYGQLGSFSNFINRLCNSPVKITYLNAINNRSSPGDPFQTSAIQLENILNKISNAIPLTEEESTRLSSLNNNDKFDLFSSSTNTRLVESSYLNKRDILKISFCLKNTNLKQINLKKKFVKNKPALNDQGNGHISALNFIGKNVTLYFACQDIEGDFSSYETLELLVNKMFDCYLAHILPVSIVLETASIQRVFPPERVCPKVSIGVVRAGRLDPLQYLSSNRSFLISLASKSVKTHKDDACIRIPWVASKLMNLDAIVFENMQKESVIISFCKQLSKSFALSIPGTNNNTKSVTLSTVLITKRVTAPFPYFICDYASPTGFASAAMTSATPFFEDSAEPSENGVTPVTTSNLDQKVILINDNYGADSFSQSSVSAVSTTNPGFTFSPDSTEPDANLIKLADMESKLAEMVAKAANDEAKMNMLTKEKEAAEKKATAIQKKLDDKGLP